MEVKLEFITPDAEIFIGRMAGICYDAEDSPERNLKRAIKCSTDGHLATLRFAHAVFNISGISRICSHQMVRSKHLDFLQRSQRYCKESQTEFVVPNSLTDKGQEIVQNHNTACLNLYNFLLNGGVKKEDARFVLPESSTTELNVVGNFQAWKDFIKLRADKHAQWEIREVAKQINNILSKECPNLFYWMP